MVLEERGAAVVFLEVPNAELDATGCFLVIEVLPFLFLLLLLNSGNALFLLAHFVLRFIQFLIHKGLEALALSVYSQQVVVLIVLNVNVTPTVCDLVFIVIELFHLYWFDEVATSRHFLRGFLLDLLCLIVWLFGSHVFILFIVTRLTARDTLLGFKLFGRGLALLTPIVFIVVIWSKFKAAVVLREWFFLIIALLRF